MKILATGSGGMLGSYLPGDAIGTDKHDLDVTDRSQVAAKLDEHQPDVVLHLAAETNVDLCEGDADHSFRTNAVGTRNIAFEAAKRDLPLVYISTAAVFSGEKHEPYNEFDVPDPSNVYAASKLAGEHYVRQFAPRSFIVRAGWMIGGGPDTEKKFIAKMLDRAAQTGQIMAVDDKWGSPCYAKHHMAGILRLIETDEYGTYHMVNRGSCSRYEMALAINEVLGSPYDVVPVPSTKFPLPAPRGRSEAADNMMLRLMGWSDWMPHWRDAIEEYLQGEGSAFAPDRSAATA